MQLICNCTQLRQQAMPLHVYGTAMDDERGYVELDFVAKTIDVGTLQRRDYLATPTGWHAGKRQYRIPSSVTGIALVELLNSRRFIELCEQFSKGFELRRDRGEWIARVSAAAQEAEKQLQTLLDRLYSRDCCAPWQCASRLFESHTLAERWSGEPLVKAVERLKQHMRLHHIHVEGNIEEAFLEKSYSDFKEGKKLDRFHIKALLKADFIGDAELAQWHGARVGEPDDAAAE